jgi:hypothetical protein
MNSTITTSSDGRGLLPDSSKNPVNRQSGPDILAERQIVLKHPLEVLLGYKAEPIAVEPLAGIVHSHRRYIRWQPLAWQHAAMPTSAAGSVLCAVFFREKPLWQRRQYVAARARRRSILSRRRKAGARFPSETGDLLPTFVDLCMTLQHFNSRAWFMLLLRRSERGSSFL